MRQIGLTYRLRNEAARHRATLTATLSADNDLTPVTVTLDLARPEDGAAVGLNLDSIGIALSDC